MTSYALILAGLIQIGIGIYLWLNGHVIEKTLKEETIIFKDLEGEFLGNRIFDAYVKGYKLIKKEPK